jgi:hypothetical protein
MFNELIIAGNRVLEMRIDQSLVDQIAAHAEQEYKKNLELSQGYPDDSDVYLFKSPASLTDPQPGPGYQWFPVDSVDVEEFKNTMLAAMQAQFQAEYKISECWFLLQTNEAWIDNPVHQHLTADWVAVAYIKVDKDSIEFRDDGGNTEVYTPTAGTVLVFPATVKHRPMPNTSSSHRISINLELNAEAEPETDLQKSRMTICNGCDKLNSLKFCGECKCFMPFKTRLIGSSCPLQKW